MRLKTHNYSARGWYFVTTITERMICHFGKISEGQMILNVYGQIAHEQWLWMNDYYDFVTVDAFVVMPNHVHAIITLQIPPGAQAPRTLSQLVGAYKTRVSARIRKAGVAEFSWHRSFHDHIIRNQAAFHTIAEYIKNNSLHWHKDRYCRTGTG